MRHGLLVLALLLPLTSPAQAEQFESFGPFVVHYSAVQTESLPAESLRLYGIQRSRNRALVSIAIRRRQGPTASEAVAAAVSGTATSLAGQVRNLDLREIRNPDAIYYVADFRLSGNDTLDFAITVTPEGGAEGHTVRFRKNFFVQ